MACALQDQVNWQSGPGRCRYIEAGVWRSTTARIRKHDACVKRGRPMTTDLVWAECAGSDLLRHGGHCGKHGA